MSYQLMATCCGQIYATDVQDQIDVDRWEGEGGAPARHPHRATPCENAGRTQVRQTSAADIRVRVALSID
jgi:hypothetical protein